MKNFSKISFFSFLVCLFLFSGNKALSLERCSQIKSEEEFQKFSDQQLKSLVGEFTWKKPEKLVWNGRSLSDAEKKQLEDLNKRNEVIAKLKGFSEACKRHTDYVKKLQRKRLSTVKTLIEDHRVYVKSYYLNSLNKLQSELDEANREIAKYTQEQRSYRNKVTTELQNLKADLNKELELFKENGSLNTSTISNISQKLENLDQAKVCRDTPFRIRELEKKAKQSHQKLVNFINDSYLDQRNRFLRLQFLKGDVFIKAKEGCFYQIDKGLRIGRYVDVKTPMVQFLNTTCVSETEAKKRGSVIKLSQDLLNAILLGKKMSWIEFDELLGSLSDNMGGSWEKHNKQYKEALGNAVYFKYPGDIMVLAGKQCDALRKVVYSLNYLKTAESYQGDINTLNELEKRVKAIMDDWYQKLRMYEIKDEIFRDAGIFTKKIVHSISQNKFEDNEYIHETYKEFTDKKALADTYFFDEIENTEEFLNEVVLENKKIIDNTYSQWKTLTEKGGVFLLSARALTFNRKLSSFKRFMRRHEHPDVLHREWKRRVKGSPLFLDSSKLKIIPRFEIVESIDKDDSKKSQRAGVMKIHLMLANLEKSLAALIEAWTFNKREIEK